MTERQAGSAERVPRAILFDVGGPIDTEVEFERLIDQHIIEALRAEGLAVTHDQVRAASDEAVHTYAPQTYAAMIWTLTGHRRSAAARALEAVNARSEERERLRGGLELRDGIAGVIESWAARGVPLGLAANQPARVLSELEKHGVARHFTSPEVTGVHGYRKPDVRLFLRACETMGVSPTECVMVGDRIDTTSVLRPHSACAPCCFALGVT